MTAQRPLRLDERASALLLPPLLKMTGRPYDAMIAEFRENERLSPDELAELQMRKLGELLEHCYDHAPYYRAVFDELGAHPSDIRTLADYARLPTIDKARLREDPESLMSDTCCPEDLKVVYTGGSTGVSVKVYQDWEYYYRGWSAFQRNVLWTGFRPGERQAWFARPAKPDFKRRVRLALERKWMVGIAVRSEKATAEWAEGMLKRKPRFVYGYALAIAALATYALDHDIRFESVRQVMTTSETLTPQMRADIGKAFGAPVFNQYGTTEVYAIASECAHGNMHINTDMNVVEFAPVTKPGGLKTHELIVTPLYGRAQPLLRFLPGDQADPRGEQCPCGLPFPTMGPVEGRINDTLTFSGGAEVSAMLLERLVRPVPGVARFQFRQTARDTLQLLVVPDHRFNEESLATLRDTQQLFARQAGIMIDINPVLVDDIATTVSGKHRSVIPLEDETPR